MRRNYFRAILGFALIVILTGCSGRSDSLPTIASKLDASARKNSSLTLRSTTPRVNVADAFYLAVDAGASKALHTWVPDTGYVGVAWSGTATTVSAVDTSKVSSPAPQAVYQTQRYATHLTYTIPSLSPNAAYNVRLQFVESFFNAPKQRVFSIKINGTQVLSAFDIVQSAGGARIAIAEQFTSAADLTGKITIQLDASTNYASIAAIEITRASNTTTPTPVPMADISINSGGSAGAGNWIADTDYQTSGESGVAAITTAIDTSQVSSPAPQSVYQTQRWGSTVTYTFSKLVPGGAYTERLHFVESFWNAASQRVFNVTINGAQVLTNFDIFGATGRKNVAIAKQFSGEASATGSVVVVLSAAVDRATIAGIEIVAASSVATPAPTAAPTAIASPTAAPSPSPSPAPTSGTGMPWVYTDLWSTSSPLLHSVAALKASGATIVPHTYMDSLWNQGIADNGTADNIPIYTTKSTDPLVTVKCTMYGGRCNASGVQLHMPTYVTAQKASDGHIIAIDQNAPAGAMELDCWQGYLSGVTLNCSWAGTYTLGSDGIHQNGSEGIHFGPAASEFTITPQEIINGHIDHALGLNPACLNNTTLYPADKMTGTDTACAGGGMNPPHYGNLVHLVTPLSTIAQRGYSPPCMVILTALSTYGAYLDDTGNNGMQFHTDNALAYTANPATRALDPWPGIQAQLTAAGDGSGSGDAGRWKSCLNRVASSDFEMLEIVQK
jgi:hypothetical protein